MGQKAFDLMIVEVQCEGTHDPATPEKLIVAVLVPVATPGQGVVIHGVESPGDISTVRTAPL